MNKRTFTAVAGFLTIAVIASVLSTDGVFSNGAHKGLKSGSFALYAPSSDKLTPPDAVLVTPPVLGSSAGMSLGATWTLLGSSSASVFAIPTANSGVPPAQTPLTAIGIEGSLYQLWTLTAAVNSLGGLNSGLILPLPDSFANRFPGPDEITFQIFQFTTGSEATSMLSSPNFSLTSSNAQVEGFTQLNGGAINGGTVASYSSSSLGDLKDFEFQWVQGTTWVQVGVVGSFDMTLVEAAQVAAAVPA